MATVPEPIAAAPDFDRKKYGRLLSRFSPKTIETEAEHRAALAIVESLMEKGESNLSAEEDTLLELLTGLIGLFESKQYKPWPDSSPVEVLAELMESNNLKPADLAEIPGGRPRVSDILAGRRAIGKEQAKRLGERFRISPAAFL